MDHIPVVSIAAVTTTTDGVAPIHRRSIAAPLPGSASTTTIVRTIPPSHRTNCRVRAATDGVICERVDCLVGVSVMGSESV
jgi:hypothetical protein